MLLFDSFYWHLFTLLYDWHWILIFIWIEVSFYLSHFQIISMHEVVDVSVELVNFLLHYIGNIVGWKLEERIKNNKYMCCCYLWMILIVCLWLLEVVAWWNPDIVDQKLKGANFHLYCVELFLRIDDREREHLLIEDGFQR